MKRNPVRSWWAGLVGAVFVFGMSGLAPVPAAAQATVQQITDCTTAGPAPTPGTLAYAVAQGGTWAFACSGTGPFTIGIASHLDVPVGKTVTLESVGADVALSGGNSTRLFTVEGSLTLDGLTVENGRVVFPKAPGGGAILNTDGRLTVFDSTFSGNNALGDNGGGAIQNTGGTLTVSNSTFSGNFGDSGGAIYNDAGMVTISNSTFSGNTCYGPSDIGGGALASDGGTLTVSNSTFSGNTAYLGNGGAISNNGGMVTDSNSTFSGNRATGREPVLGVISTGGAIANAGTQTITNSTFSGNRATRGGAIGNLRGTLTVSNSTLSGNSASEGGNLYGGGTLYNMIVANATSGGNCSGTFSGNNDLEYGDASNTCGGAVWVTGNPELGPLQDNGGPTQTMALGSGSAAIGAGDPAICAGAPVNGFDQRGVARGATTATCDIGAYQATAPSRADLAAQYVVQPSPIAATGTLASGQTVAATVSTETYAGAMAPDVPLYLSFTGGTGSASVGGVALTATPQLFTSDGAGRVVVQYTAGTTPIGAGTDTITVADAATHPTLQASDGYTYVTFASLGRLAAQFETQPGIANALSAKLGAAAAAAARSNTQALQGALGAFQNAVRAQVGKTLTEAQAAILIREARQLQP